MNKYLIIYKTPINSHNTYFLIADSFSDAENWFLDYNYKHRYEIIQIIKTN